jgi:hypothetical protein
MEDDSNLPSRLTPNQLKALAFEKAQGGTSFKDVKSRKDQGKIETLSRKLKADDKKINDIDTDVKEFTNKPIKQNKQAGTVLTIPPSEYKPGQYKQKPILNYINKLREKIFGSKRGTQEENELRKDLIKVGTQTVIVNKLLETNTETLHEVAKKDIELAKLLKRLGDSRNAELSKKVESGQEIFPEEAGEIVGHLEDVAYGLDNVGVALKLEIPDVIQTVQDLLNNNKLDIDTRRQYFADLAKVLSSEDVNIDPKLLEDIKNINIKATNFTEKELESLNSILDTLKATSTGEKIYGSIKDLKKQLGTIILNQEELHEFQEQEGAKKLTSKGLGAIPEQVKSGLLNSLFASLGLPGLGSLLGALGVDAVGLATKGIGAISSLPKFLKGVVGSGESTSLGGGFLSGAIESIQGILTKVAQTFTEVIAPVVVFASAISGAVTGIMETMDEWKNFFSGLWDLGKSFVGLISRLVGNLEDAVPILKPIIEGLKDFASFIFKLPVTLVKMIFEGFKNIFGWLGIGAGGLGDLFKSGAKFLDTIGVSGNTDITNTGDTIGMNMAIPTSNAAVSPLAYNMPVQTMGAVNPSIPSMDTSASATVSKLDNMSMVNQAKIADNSGKQITVPVIIPQDKKTNQPANRQHGVDDLSTAMMNNGLINQ